MKTLLAIVKDTDSSESYISYLMRMAGELNAGLHLLHTQFPIEYPLGMPGSTGASSAHLQLTLQERAKDARKALSRLVEKLDEGTPGSAHVEISSEIGSTGSIIEKYINDVEKIMIVLENQGNESLWTQDYTNMEIIHNCRCPVCIIPKKAKYHPYDEIVYATDYNEEDIPTLKKLIGLLRKFSPHITALHITDSTDFEARIKTAGFTEMAHDRTGYEKVTVKTLNDKEDEDLGLLINDFAALVSANLIVVLKENRHFLERIFRPDLTKKIIRQANIPVLVFHEDE